MYDEQGEKTWDCTLDVYGKVANFEGSSLKECPFRYQGQYEDEETGLYYNRFRYYSVEEGMYISQDPIGLVGGFNLYSYVSDLNGENDILGLSKSMAGKARAWAEARALKKKPNPPRMVSAAVSRKTGKVYYGTSQAGKEVDNISATMKSQIKDGAELISGREFENCSEFNAVNNATRHGEKISDLDIETFEVDTLNPRLRCDNCKVSTDGGHVKKTKSKVKPY